MPATACRRLIAAILGRAGDDNPTHPVKDFFPFGEGQAAEIIRQMQGNPPTLGRADVAEIMPIERTRLVRQFRLEIAFRQPIPHLDPAQDVKTGNRPRDTLAVDSGQKRLVIEGFCQTNDSAVELPVTVAKPAHMVDKRILKARRIVGRLE